MNEDPPKRDITGDAVDRLIRLGACALNDTELVSLVFGAAAPAALLESGVHALACIDPAELADDNRVGPLGAARFHAALELCHRLATRPDPRPKLPTPEAIFGFMQRRTFTLSRERLTVLCFNSRNVLTHEFVAAEGTWDQVSADVREIFRPALIHKACALVLVHNHPSGDPEPSVQDVRLTHLLIECARLLSIRLLDHLVITPTRFVSFKQRGYFKLDALPNAVLTCHDSIDRDPPG